MHRKKYYISALICLVMMVASMPASAQRGKKKQASRSSVLREAEFYFTEGEKYYILEDYAKALVLFQKSLDINPLNATVYFKIAQIHVQGNELEKALENVQMALELEGGNKYFYVLAADIHTQLGDFATAAEIYEKLTTQIEGTDLYLFELAALYLYQNRYDDAITIYDKIEQVYGLSEEVVYQKQKIYLQTNQLDKAIEEGQKLIDNFPEEESYVLKQVEILLANEKYNEAEKYLQDFITISPENSQSLLVLSELRRKKGDMTGAFDNLKSAFINPDLSVENKVQLIAEYRNELDEPELKTFALPLANILVKTHPAVADAHTVHADLLQAVGDSEGAKSAYMKALELDKSNFTIWQNVLQLYSELHKIDSVIIVSDQALEFFPNQSTLFYYNGSANLQKRNYDEAIYALEQGRRLSSANLNLLSLFNAMLGTAYNGTGQYKKSDAAFDAALDFDADNHVVLNNYSYYLALRKDNLDKAEKMSSRVVKENPENVTYLDTYAWVLFVRGKYKEARKAIEKAIKIGGVSAIHYEHYGDIMYKLGDIDAAVKQWQTAKGLNPNSELIDKKIADRKLYE